MIEEKIRGFVVNNHKLQSRTYLRQNPCVALPLKPSCCMTYGDSCPERYMAFNPDKKGHLHHVLLTGIG